ncbi:hypothetical protein [Streptomyces albus]|uniref:hypothetical protein n=1 Tax=Streptomyces sp. NRRL F-5917 TaxID=1463873 RepID=UPI0004C04BC1|nr:hypothetical protein [Streptomyces sp. NRRL F-5917]
MTWHFERGQHALDLIFKLPREEQFRFFNLLSDLEIDPDLATEGFGLNVPGPVRMRSAPLGTHKAVLLVCDHAKRVTLVNIVRSTPQDPRL